MKHKQDITDREPVHEGESYDHVPMSAAGTNLTFRNVSLRAAMRGKADIKQAALSRLDL